MVFKNRAAQRRADKAALCLHRGTKVPGQIRCFFGPEVMTRLEQRVYGRVGEKIAAEEGALARLAPRLQRRLIGLVFRSAGFAAA